MGIIQTGVGFVKDNAQIILTGISIASTVGAVVTSAQATPLAVRLLADAQDKKGSELTTSEKIKAVVPAYGPTGALTLLSIVSSAGATILGQKRQTELLGMVLASDKLVDKYSKKLIERLGPEDKELKKEVIQETVPRLIPGDVGVFETGEGQEMIYDSWSGRMIRSSEEAVRLHYAQFMENLNFDPDTFWPINDFYGLCYIPETGSGRHMGYTSTYKPGDLNFTWDSDRQIYKIMYFDNEPLAEIRG